MNSSVRDTCLFTSRVDYCNSVLQRECTPRVWPMQNSFNPATRRVLNKRKCGQITADIRNQLHALATGLKERSLIRCAALQRVAQRSEACAELVTAVLHFAAGCIHQQRHWL